MTHRKLTPEQARIFERRVQDRFREMDDQTTRFLYENPDVLRTILSASMRDTYEKMRITVPSADHAALKPDDATGWSLLRQGMVKMSAVTRTIAVDYRPEREDVLKAAKLQYDLSNREEIEDRTERKRILRAGGVVTRRLKRVWLDCVGAIVELESIARLKNWRLVDARSLVAWGVSHGAEIEMSHGVYATQIPKLLRSGDSLRLASSLTSQCGPYGPYAGFDRADVGSDPEDAVFPFERCSFLFEIPDDRDA